jgi:hypothetical protein
MKQYTKFTEQYTKFVGHYAKPFLRLYAKFVSVNYQ